MRTKSAEAKTGREGWAADTGGPRPRPEAPRRGPARRRFVSRDGTAAAVMIAPNAVMYTLFVIIPALAGVALSFYEWNLFDDPVFVGLDNYRDVLTDDDAWAAMVNTIEFMVLGVLPTVLVGFVLAVLVNTRMRGVGTVRVLYFVPLVVSTAVASVLWSWLYQPQSGIFNYLLSLVGIDGPAWLANTTWALPALTLMIIWMSLPLVIILYLAALQRIPDEIMEAAKIDGAGVWRRVWQIIWPNVSAMTLLVLALQVLNFLSAPFETALIMTQGGPIDSTTALSLYIYRVAFEQGEIGAGSALSMIQFLLIVLLAGGLRLIHRVRVRRA